MAVELRHASIGTSFDCSLEELVGVDITQVGGILFVVKSRSSCSGSSTY